MHFLKRTPFARIEFRHWSRFFTALTVLVGTTLLSGFAIGGYAQPNLEDATAIGGAVESEYDRLIREGQTVRSFPLHEYWLDIGRPEDYQRAQEDVRLGRLE